MTTYFTINTEELCDEHADEFIQAAIDANNASPSENWVIYINSGGGNMEAGSAIFDTIKAHAKWGGGQHHVTTVVRGKAYSMAAILSQAGDNRKIGALSLLMFHSPEVSLEASLSDVADEVQIMQWWWDKCLEIMAERSGQCTAEEFGKASYRRNWYVDAEEALELGLVDEIG